MSVMNGFKTDLTEKILGLNPHVIVEPNSFEINDKFISKLKKNYKEIDISKSYSGEGIIFGTDNAKGVILKGVDAKEKNIENFFKKFISKGEISNFGINSFLLVLNLLLI